MDPHSSPHRILIIVLLSHSILSTRESWVQLVLLAADFGGHWATLLP